MGTPRVSVLMPVFNGALHLRESVESILAQDFRDFEFLVLDDGSTDDSARILGGFSDPRLRVISAEQNQGLTRSLIEGLGHTRGELIARQDADDVSEPDRLAQQLAYLDRYPQVACVGCQGHILDEEGEPIGATRLATDSRTIHDRLPRENQFIHGALMIRRSALDAVGGYRGEFRFAQDYDLVLRLSEYAELANLPQPLYRQRLRREMISMARGAEQRGFAELARGLAAERRQGGADALQRGETVTVSARGTPAALDYEDRVVNLCLRSGNLRRARRGILRQLRAHPFRPRAWGRLALTGLGPGLVRQLARQWDRARYGDAG